MSFSTTISSSSKVNFLVGLPYLGYLRQDPEIKKQLTECFALGGISMAGMAQMLLHMLFFDPSHPNMMCIYKTHKSTRTWVHTSRGRWIQVENSVFISRIVEWMDNALSGHVYVEDFNFEAKHDLLSSLRNTCLQYGFVRTALSIEDVLEMAHVAADDLTTPLTNKQKMEFDEIIFGYILRICRTMKPPNDVVNATFPKPTLSSSASSSCASSMSDEKDDRLIHGEITVDDDDDDDEAEAEVKQHQEET